MYRIYVAGALSGTALQYLENMRRMMCVCVRLWLMKVSPFCPCLDYHYALMRPELEDRPLLDDFYRASLSWVKVSDAVLVLPNWEGSKGTQAEIAEAVRLGIPVFLKPQLLLRHFDLPLDPALDVLFEKWESEPV